MIKIINKHWNKIINLFVGLIIVLVLVVPSLGGCSKPNETKTFLEKQGYTEIETGGYRWFSCGRDYQYRTEFKAKNTNGQIITGCVCEGIFAGKVIKFD